MMEVDPLSYLPGEVKLMAVSDGSLRDAGYQASATCGWVVYGYMIREKEYSWGGWCGGCRRFCGAWGEEVAHLTEG